MEIETMTVAEIAEHLSTREGLRYVICASYASEDMAAIQRFGRDRSVDFGYSASDVYDALGLLEVAKRRILDGATSGDWTAGGSNEDD